MYVRLVCGGLTAATPNDTHAAPEYVREMRTLTNELATVGWERRCVRKEPRQSSNVMPNFRSTGVRLFLPFHFHCHQLKSLVCCPRRSTAAHFVTAMEGLIRMSPRMNFLAPAHPPLEQRARARVAVARC